MAVVVGSTEVINDSAKLVNISGADGTYDAFHPNVSTIINVLDMNRPVMNVVMTGNTTFGESNKAVGKTAILLLDRTASGHSPIFSSNIKWAQDAEPDWTDYRFWNIALVCWNTATIRAAAVGFNA